MPAATVASGVLAKLRAQPRIRRVAGRVRALAGVRSGEDSLRLLLAYTLARDACCIDVGAHEGDVLRDILRVAPDGRHLAFEPLPHLAAALEKRYPAVEVHAAALSDRAGEAEFVHVRSNPAYSGLKERDYPGEEQLERLTVRTERLDDVLPAGFEPAFIKVDVEGAELQVFQGAADTLARHRPTVFFEHGYGGADRYGTSSGQIHDLLVGEAGLRIFDEHGRGPYSRDELESVFTQPIWNFVAHR
jgi:FkbM family methyltransferase